jgi:PilZ domain
MDEKRKDPRIPLMSRVAVEWQYQDGTQRTASATLEDKSRSGACIRLKEAIPVGTKLTVKGPRGELDYQVMNSRMETGYYVLGLRNHFNPINLEE